MWDRCEATVCSFSMKEKRDGKGGALWGDLSPFIYSRLKCSRLVADDLESVSAAGERMMMRGP